MEALTNFVGFFNSRGDVMKTIKVTTDWQLESLMIAAAAVRMPSWGDDGLPYVEADSLPDIDRALVEANREIVKLHDLLAEYRELKAFYDAAMEHLTPTAFAMVKSEAQP